MPPVPFPCNESGKKKNPISVKAKNVIITSEVLVIHLA